MNSCFLFQLSLANRSVSTAKHNLLHKGDVRRISRCEAQSDIKCRYCISNYCMIVVKTFWTSTSFDRDKRDKRSWPISFNLAIRNKEKAWEEIVSSFDSHIPHHLHLPTFVLFLPWPGLPVYCSIRHLYALDELKIVLRSVENETVLDDFVSNQTIPQSV